jgi:hypothetical protein
MPEKSLVFKSPRRATLVAYARLEPEEPGQAQKPRGPELLTQAGARLGPAHNAGLWQQLREDAVLERVDVVCCAAATTAGLERALEAAATLSRGARSGGFRTQQGLAMGVERVCREVDAAGTAPAVRLSFALSTTLERQLRRLPPGAGARVGV